MVTDEKWYSKKSLIALPVEPRIKAAKPLKRNRRRTSQADQTGKTRWPWKGRTSGSGLLANDWIGLCSSMAPLAGKPLKLDSISLSTEMARRQWLRGARTAPADASLVYLAPHAYAKLDLSLGRFLSWGG